MSIVKLFWINIILKASDIILTLYIIKNSNINAESNPFVRNSMLLYGVYPTMVIITLGHISLLYLLYNRNRKSLLKVITLLMSLLIIINLSTAIL